MMKKVLFSVLAALTLASTGAAYAAGDYRLSAGEFEDFNHGYNLSTGDRIYFTQQGRQSFFVQLGGHKRERMYAQSRGVFMTQSGARVEFADQGWAVTIKNFEMMSPQIAQQGLKDVTLASR
jgi:hypothetical protein